MVVHGKRLKINVQKIRLSLCLLVIKHKTEITQVKLNNNNEKTPAYENKKVHISFTNLISMFTLICRNPKRKL